MPFAIELFFDPKLDLEVQRLGQALEKRGIPAIFSTLGATPHVSLAVFDSYDGNKLHSTLKKLSGTFPPRPAQLSALGTFPGKEGVLFLSPKVGRFLLEIHEALHRFLPGVTRGNWDYYLPENWVPHCTLSIHLSPGELAAGMDLVRKKFSGLKGRYARLALVEVDPGLKKPIRLISSIPLSGKKRNK
ncbi:MAG TPA: 2'-5' RNA ligase family protein [bacterium]|nr:2'-5' RNA ligase family protein [bacterium]